MCYCQNVVTLIRFDGFEEVSMGVLEMNFEAIYSVVSEKFSNAVA